MTVSCTDSSTIVKEKKYKINRQRQKDVISGRIDVKSLIIDNVNIITV